MLKSLARRTLCLGLTLFVPHVAHAQTAGWTYLTPVTVTNPNPALEDQQVRIVVDTAALVTAGRMASDGRDLRITSSCASGLLPYWIQPGTMNTAATVIWTKGNVPAGTSNLFVDYGNAAAVDASSLTSVFIGNAQDAGAAFTHTNKFDTQTIAPGGVGDSQRASHFRAEEDVLVVGLGRNEPSGSTRTVNLFDFTTQQILLTADVAGPAAQWSFASASPTWLEAGHEYVLNLHQGATDGYYFGPVPPGLHPALTFLDMRYCNGCSATTFPTQLLTGLIYGVPDLQFYTYKHPAQPITTAVSATCVETALCTAACGASSCGDGATNATAGEECDDGNQIDTDACRNDCTAATCGDGVVRENVEACDDGNQIETDACRNDCTAAACGDGIVRENVEACDDGNTIDTDGCRNDCAVASCGDGVVQADVEACDDGNVVDTDDCLATCVAATCGDGNVRAGAETCDDSNTTDGDGCSATCAVETPVVDGGASSSSGGSSSGGSSSGGSSSGGRADGGASSSGGSSSSSSSSGSEPNVDPSSPDGGGCSCRTTEADASTHASWLLGALGVAALLRFRRRPRAS